MDKIAIAKTKYIRISPRKIVGITKLVRGKDIALAKAVLMQTAKKGARIIEKTLNSAVANAKNKNMDVKNLYISRIVADMGPSLKRHIFWSRGDVRPIKKRTTHLTIVLEERVGGKKVIKQVSSKQISKKTAKTEVKEEKNKKPIIKEKKVAKPKVRVKKNV